MAGLSYAQYVILTVASLVSCALSTLGSALIMSSILRRRKLLMHDRFHNLLFFMSLSDGLAGMAVASFIVAWPKEALEEGTHSWALGNHASCSVAAFCYILFGTVAAFYHCCIAIHFLVIVRGSKRKLSSNTCIHCLTPAQRRRMPLIVAHGMSISVPLALSVAGAITNSYYPRTYPMICYFDVPPDTSDAAEPIDRTTPAAILRISRSLIAIALGVISIVCTMSLYCRVRHQLQQSNQRNTNQYRRFSSTLEAATPRNALRTSSLRNLRSSITSRPDHRQNTTEDHIHSNHALVVASNHRFQNRLRAVAVQAFWYLVAYLNSFFFILIGWMVARLGDDIGGREGDPGPFILNLMITWFMPFQGALTFIVFVRPRYQAWRVWLQKNEGSLVADHEETEDENPIAQRQTRCFQSSLFWKAFQKAIWDEIPSPVHRQRGQLHLQHHHNESHIHPQEQSTVEAAWEHNQANSRSFGLLLSLEHDCDLEDCDLDNCDLEESVCSSEQDVETLIPSSVA